MFEVPVTLTSYHPINTALEGGVRDRKSRPLITLQQHQSDPVNFPYVSVAGDFTIWPDGQRISIPSIDPNAIFRIVDTGGHFYGAGKVIRYTGHEPLDICTEVGTTIGPVPTSVQVIEGDSFVSSGGPIIAASTFGINTNRRAFSLTLLGIAAAAWLFG